jgi:hypothetical protein
MTQFLRSTTHGVRPNFHVAREAPPAPATETAYARKWREQARKEGHMKRLPQMGQDVPQGVMIEARKARLERIRAILREGPIQLMHLMKRLPDLEQSHVQADLQVMRRNGEAKTNRTTWKLTQKGRAQ